MSQHEHDAPHQRYTLQPISIPGFEGPLDLLLSLIEDERLDVTSISLAAVTDQYLARLKAMEHLPPEHLADFLVVAATLLLIKSKRLFPDLSLTDEEEEQAASLASQLREYRRFRGAAKAFIELWNSGAPLHARAGFQGIATAFYPPPRFGPSELQGALAAVLAHLPKLDLLTEEVIRRVVSLEERIRDIQDRIARQAHMSFQEVARSAASKVEVIVSFLALLELVKQRLVVAEQAGAFRDILVKRPFDARQP